MDQIQGFIERITFQNPDTGFTVAQVQEPKKKETTCVVGKLGGAQPGESIRCFGEWKRHLVYGQQLQVERYQTEMPADEAGIRKYLGSGLIKGIGPTYADKIVDHFGTQTLNIIDETPKQLTEIQGIGPKRLGIITSCWQEQRIIRDIMIFLQKYGVTPTYAQKIFRVYEQESIEKVSRNPYSLARDIRGIGFKTADAIANKMGIEKNSPRRIEAGIEYTLSELSNDGNTCYPLDEFTGVAATMLEVEETEVTPLIEQLVDSKRVVVQPLEERPFIWFSPLYLSEIGITQQISRIREGISHLRSVDLPKALEWVQRYLRINLAPNQEAAVSSALTEKFLIITGGPGTGKSTITNAILAVTSKITKKILLAAPTGRAAKRMSEITRRKAYTIHALLEFNFKIGKFKFNQDNPLDCDLIIIDEASMIDTVLMNQLLKAIPSRARVIFVGDINQLPSVGPGNVLKDIIASQVVPVNILTEIFRQAKGSRIITNAHRINSGDFPDISNQSNSDFFFIEAETPEEVSSNIISLATTRIPQKYKLDPLESIQILSPMKRGAIGTEALNLQLQNALNPTNSDIYPGGQRLIKGDKVMQTRNNYQKNVYNGDIGLISKIDAVNQTLFVVFDGKEVEYTFSEVHELVLAYAVSVHKYQGSECTCIIMPIHTTHFKLLHRNLLYTGVTRGKKLVILVGTKKALAIATKNDEIQRRYTGLKQALS